MLITAFFDLTLNPSPRFGSGYWATVGERISAMLNTSSRTAEVRSTTKGEGLLKPDNEHLCTFLLCWLSEAEINRAEINRAEINRELCTQTSCK